MVGEVGREDEEKCWGEVRMVDDAAVVVVVVVAGVAVVAVVLAVVLLFSSSLSLLSPLVRLRLRLRLVTADLLNGPNNSYFRMYRKTEFGTNPSALNVGCPSALIKVP